MGDEAAADPMGEENSEESEIDSDFEFDDEIKEGLHNLLNIPLEFMDDSSDEGDAQEAEVLPEKKRGDSVERQMEALFVGDGDVPGEGETESSEPPKDSGLENISDNELDGPESGECDTSDGELPDSPNIVVTLPDSPPSMISKNRDVEEISADGDSDVELVGEFQSKGKEYCDNVAQKITLAKPNREVVITESESHKSKEKKEGGSGTVKEKSSGKNRLRDKKDKGRKKAEGGGVDEETRNKLKLKKYLARLDQYRAKCLDYMNQIATNHEMKKSDKRKTHLETDRMSGDSSKIKSVVEKVNKERESSPHSSTSSKFDQVSRGSHSSRGEKLTHNPSPEQKKRRSRSAEKGRKSKERRLRNKSNELKEHKIKYQQYIQYLQSERAKCYEERLALSRHKNKLKRKHRKSESCSPEKTREKTPVVEKKEARTPVMSFSEFCNSRELVSPEREAKPLQETSISVNNDFEILKERVVPAEPAATLPSSTSHIDHADDDKDLFITYSELVEQDKMKETRLIEDEQANIEKIVDKDPEMKSISVFTRVLFKDSAEEGGIPFLQGGCPPSPKLETPTPKPHQFVESTGPDDIYDWNDDLSTISQSSLSPSRSPVPKLHNKALLNFVVNQKEQLEKRKAKKAAAKLSLKKPSKSSRSRSKSPKKDATRLKKRKMKHQSSISASPSPPPLKPRSPENCKKRTSPSAHLKERWRDYPSPPERRREHYDRPSRSRRRSRSRTRVRVGHRSRSSSEERHYRRYRSRSRSRTPPPVMVQLSVTEKRRKLKEEHERALASLRATIRKPMSTAPLVIGFSGNGDSYEPVMDNYDSVGMNEVKPASYDPRNSSSHRMAYHPHSLLPPPCWRPSPNYFYYPSF